MLEVKKNTPSIPMSLLTDCLSPIYLLTNLSAFKDF